MYEHLRGTLEEKSPAHAVVDIGGVGFFVSIPLSTFERLPAAGGPVMLYTSHVVREDSHRLYGFATRDERAFFLALQSVSGVGPAVALSIVSSMDFDAFRSAVAAGDAALLRRVRGIGRRLSERLVVELKDKLPDLPLRAPVGAPAADAAIVDATLALVELGYARDAAMRVLRELRVAEPSVENAGELVRRALARL